MISASRFRFAVPLLLAVFTCMLCGVAMLAGCGSSQGDSSSASSSAPASSLNAEEAAEANRETALSFANGWYGDWSFENGQMQLGSSTPAKRCASYVEAGTALADELEQLAIAREAARCATQVEVKSAEGDTVELEIEYVTTQNTGIDAAAFAQLQERAATDDLVFHFEDDGLISEIEGLN